LGELGIDGRKILKFILNIVENVDWIHLLQSKVQWRAFVNMVTNFRVS